MGWSGLSFVVVLDACGGVAGVDLPNSDARDASAADGGAVADARALDGAATFDGTSGSDAEPSGPSCADLLERMNALMVKTCAAADDCAVATVYNCCAVYTGIRKDKLAGFTAAQTAYQSACPDARGCGCQNHTETGDLVESPTGVVATCDGHACTAHVQ